MDARTVWFRETGEGRTKEQLLIETMFCVYYLSKSSAVFVTRELQSHSFLALLPAEPRGHTSLLLVWPFRGIERRQPRSEPVRLDRGDGVECRCRVYIC